MGRRQEGKEDDPRHPKIEKETDPGQGQSPTFVRGKWSPGTVARASRALC